MKLFENESIVIDKIHAVDKYTSEPGEYNEYGTYFNTYELVYFMYADSITTVDNAVINDVDGSFRYMPKGQTCGKYTCTTRKPVMCIDIYFDTQSPMPPHAFGYTLKTDLKDKFIKLYKIWQKKDVDYHSSSMMIFYDIIATIQREYRSYLPIEQKENIRDCYEYILENFRTREFDYKKLCEISGYKYTRFNEIFKKAYNMTPLQTVTRLKCNYAKELLVTGRYSVSEIAEMCGFENVYYFSNVFKKQTGFAPSKYFSSYR